MGSIWNWFNGRKTALGLVLVALAQFFLANPAVDASLFGTHASRALSVCGWVVTALGAGHKFFKGQ